MNYLYPHQLLFLHMRIIEVSGGSQGVRDQGLLKSAIYRPQASFGGADLYPDVFAKTAALGHSLVKNHPFVDGNKRTGFAAMRLFLRMNDLDLRASEDQKFDLIMKLASNREMDEQHLTEWLRPRSKEHFRR